MLTYNIAEDKQQLKNYFRKGLSKDDYYTRDELIAGQWRGKGAEKLELKGAVTKEDFHDLVDNINPKTKERLTVRNKANRRISYDFTFSVPKSVSLVYAITKDERILASFQASMYETMRAMEQEVEVRVRKNGANHNRQSSNLVWAEFVHGTSRPVAGTPDMHLHGHSVAFNASWDEVEGQWKAADFEPLISQRPYYQEVFESRVAVRLNEMGYPIVTDGKSWEIAGIERYTIDKFSRRTQEINAKAEALGIDDPAVKAQLGAKTRANKATMNAAELDEYWLGRLTKAEATTIGELHKQAKRTKLRVTVAQPMDVNDALEYAILHEFERNAVVTDKELLRTALVRSRGKARLEELEAALIERPRMHFREQDNELLVTTEAVLQEEKQMIDFVVAGKGRYRALGNSETNLRIPIREITPNNYLTQEQETVIREVLASQDRVTAIQGKAGTGKTTLLKALQTGIETRRTKLVAFAPTAEAARGALREAGFSQAETVKKLLLDKDLQRACKNNVILMDEFGLCSSPDMRGVFRIAEEQNARVILVGDRGQHKPVQRGYPAQMLPVQAGMQVVELNAIKRQQGKYRRVVEHLSQGKVSETKKALALLDDMGAIHEESDPNQRRKNLVSRYELAEEAGETTVVISPTRVEGKSLVADLRASRRKRGYITGLDGEFTRQEDLDLTEAQKQDTIHYQRGQVVQFNRHAPGFPAGKSVRVVEVIPDQAVYVENDRRQQLALPLDKSRRYQVFAEDKLTLAQGDKVRITKNSHVQIKGKTGRRRVENGQVYDVVGFTAAGDIDLGRGLILPKDHGHFDQGYVLTSHGAQSKNVDRVFILQSQASSRVASLEQLYVSASRGQLGLEAHVDDRIGFERNALKSETRLSAAEMMSNPQAHNMSRAELQNRMNQKLRSAQYNRQSKAKTRQQQKSREHGQDEMLM